MNKMLIIGMVFLSFQASSHSQYPGEIKKRVIGEYDRVDITLTNMFDSNTCFEIEHNGQFLKEQHCLNPNKTKKIKVLVKNIKDKTAVNTICSVSIIKGSSTRTRMCTKVQTYWPYSLLHSLDL